MCQPNTAEEKKVDSRIDLWKFEYEKCFERYENLYKSIWGQLNYSLIASGAVLTFGKETFKASELALLAGGSLVFWYWATFEPLNRYADKVAFRLSEIESAITHYMTSEEKYSFEMSHFRDFVDARLTRRSKKWHDTKFFGKASFMLLLGLMVLCLIGLSASIYYKKPLDISKPVSFLAFAFAICFCAISINLHISFLEKVPCSESDKSQPPGNGQSGAANRSAKGEIFFKISRVRPVVRIVFWALQFALVVLASLTAMRYVHPEVVKNEKKGLKISLTIASENQDSLAPANGKYTTYLPKE